MRVLFVTSEVAGLYKLGGLGDVSYSLPVALRRLGVDVSIILPYYAKIKTDHMKCVGQMAVDFDGKRELVFVFRTTIGQTQVPVYLIRHPLLNEYHTDDTAATFAFFCTCVVRLILYASDVVGGAFDVVHCHDWHTALVPMLLGETRKSTKTKTIESIGAKTVLTIHNLLYSGETGTKVIKKIGLPESLFHLFKTPLGHAIKLMREGLDYVDVISTVSPTYASEISDDTKGHIGAVLHARRDRVVGILNGIDPDIWDPKTDPALPVHYDILSVHTGKPKVKKQLQESLKLPGDHVPLFGFVGRIEPRQKGTDLIRAVIAKITDLKYHLVILGTGDPTEEKKLIALTKKYHHIRFVNTFDERLARRIYAGSDVMLVPSKFEPCGLTQMIAMRYGTIPLVRKTGGLADSVAHGRTGFVFTKYLPKSLESSMREAITCWNAQPDQWSALVQRVMKEDFSWTVSAKKYVKVYDQLIH